MTNEASPPAPSDREPLVEARDLVLGGETKLETSSLRVDGRGLVCLGEAARLPRVFLEPERIERGRLAFLGATASELLRSGRASYAPRRLPGGDELRVADALGFTARLAGATSKEVDRALERTHAGLLGKKKLGELSRFQARLVGLAHALVASSELLVLDDPFLDLDDEEAAIVDGVLECELDHARFVAGVTADSPWSRRLAARATSVLISAAGQLTPLDSLRSVPTSGFWITTLGPVDALATHLEGHGLAIARSANPKVLWARAESGLELFDRAAEAGVSIARLTPSAWGTSPTAPLAQVTAGAHRSGP